MIPFRWVADECVQGSLVENLRAGGQDVLFIAEQYSGEDDEFVLSVAVSERRLLLTQDLGFGKSLRHRFSELPGIVFLRIPPARAGLRWLRLSGVIDEFGERLLGRLLVVEEGRTRARALKMMR